MDGGFRDGERVVIREERILSSRGEIRSSLGNELPADSRLVPCNYKLVRFSRGIAWVRAASIGSRLSRSCLVRTVYISDDNDTD